MFGLIGYPVFTQSALVHVRGVGDQLDAGRIQPIQNGQIVEDATNFRSSSDFFFTGVNRRLASIATRCTSSRVSSIEIFNHRLETIPIVKDLNHLNLEAVN